MDPINPYTAPQTDRLQVGEPYTSTALAPAQVLFSLEGRIGRAQYWKYSLLVMLGAIAAIFAVGVVAGLLGLGQVFTEFAPLILLAPLGWISLALNVKRFHDRNRSGWWLLLGCVPFGNIWVAIESGFLAGTPGRNDFGMPSG